MKQLNGRLWRAQEQAKSTCGPGVAVAWEEHSQKKNGEGSTGGPVGCCRGADPGLGLLLLACVHVKMISLPCTSDVYTSPCACFS